MTKIVNFVEIRRDGKAIPEFMTVDEMQRRGWIPEKIAAVRWETNGQVVERKARHGVLSAVLPARDGVVVLEKADERGQKGTLLVLNSDGTHRLLVPNVQRINGSVEQGQFRWFEKARSGLQTCFGVVFELDSDESQFQLDIDAATGDVLDVYPLR